MIAGVCITVVDVMLILALQSRGFRFVESIVIEIVANPEMLYLAVGIVGATVMPHNLYLHSAIVQTRRHDKSETGTPARRSAARPSTRTSRSAWLISSTPPS